MSALFFVFSISDSYKLVLFFSRCSFNLNEIRLFPNKAHLNLLEKSRKHLSRCLDILMVTHSKFQQMLNALLSLLNNNFVAFDLCVCFYQFFFKEFKFSVFSLVV